MDGMKLREVMGHFATGVAVVTTMTDDNDPYGLTVNSLTSLSLEPPLILFCLDRGLGGLGLFEEGSHFALNVLSEDQQEISTQFARKGIEDRFSSVKWHKGASGCPLFDDALAYIDCNVEQLFPGGDHVIIVGRVNSASVNRAGSSPLVFYTGKYTAVPIA